MYGPANLPASHPFAPSPSSGLPRGYGPDATSTSSASGSLCAAWARDVATSCTASSAVAGPSRPRTSTCPSPSSVRAHNHTHSLPAPPRPASQSLPLSPTPTSRTAPLRITKRSSASSSTSTSTTATASTTASTSSSECESFIAALPAHMFGSVARRGEQTLEERHLEVEVQGAVVARAWVQRV